MRLRTFKKILFLVIILIAGCDNTSILDFRPFAHAGDDFQVKVGNTVTIETAHAYDLDNQALQYTWRVVSSPMGSTVAQFDTDSISPSYLFDLPGDYVLSLIVSDGKLESVESFVTITAFDVFENATPVAKAGSDFYASINEVVYLNANRSYDADNDPIMYQWEIVALPEGSNSTLSADNIYNPAFVPDVVGTYVFSLVISDGREQSVPSFIEVRVTPVIPEMSPLARQSGCAACHDIANSLIGPSWLGVARKYQRMPDSRAYLIDKVKNGGGGNWVEMTDGVPMPPYSPRVSDQNISLLVDFILGLDSNGQATQSPINNTSPTAHAGENVLANPGATIRLDASKSFDLDNDDLSYQWRFISKPVESNAELSNHRSYRSSFFADVAGFYLLAVEVNDGINSSSRDTVLVHIQESKVNAMPQLAIRSGCTACHVMSENIVGPSWRNIANRYKNVTGIRSVLINKVKSGGKGSWSNLTGGVPMPPYSPRVSDSNIEELVDYILSLNSI